MMASVKNYTKAVTWTDLLVLFVNDQVLLYDKVLQIYQWGVFTPLIYVATTLHCLWHKSWPFLKKPFPYYNFFYFQFIEV